MPHYRVYVTTSDNDQEAIGKAKQFVNGRFVELWEGARFIVRFPASSLEGRAPVTPLDQLRLRLPDHDFDRLMQAAKHITSPERDAFLKDIAADSASTKWSGRAYCIGSSAKCSSAMISLISAAERSPPQG